MKCKQKYLSHNLLIAEKLNLKKYSALSISLSNQQNCKIAVWRTKWILNADSTKELLTFCRLGCWFYFKNNLIEIITYLTLLLFEWCHLLSGKNNLSIFLILGESSAEYWNSQYKICSLKRSLDQNL